MGHRHRQQPAVATGSRRARRRPLAPSTPGPRRHVVAVAALVAVALVTAAAAAGGWAASPSPVASAAGRRTGDPTRGRLAGAPVTLPLSAGPEAPRPPLLTPPTDPDPAAPGQVVASGQDQSDPFLLLDGGRYHLYTSGIPGSWGSPGLNVPVTSASRFGAWGPVTDALPVLPPWAAPGFTWAPDVHRFPSHSVLYFTAEVRGSDPPMECIGDAVGSTVTGPFRALPQPLLCQANLGGDIDPRVFVAPDGSDYLLWKSDENIGGASTPTQMWSQPLSPDGLSLVGRPSLLLQPDQSWEGTIVEAPDMVYAGGSYWMVFSGNWFNQPAYAVGAARCDSPLGPCADLPANPLLASNAQGQGPGEASLFADSAGVWLLYSPWRSLSPHPDLPPRPVMITRLGIAPAGPYLAAGGPPPSLAPPRPARPRPRSARSSP